jgi:ribosome-associated protein
VSSHKQAQPPTPQNKSTSAGQPWLAAYRAAESKKAVGLRVLDLRDVTTFTDFFVICGGTNSRQIQAISDEITLELKKFGELPNSVEGYNNAEWVLIDYGDFIVHVFSAEARTYYDIERLWRGAKDVTPAGD